MRREQWKSPAFAGLSCKSSCPFFSPVMNTANANTGDEALGAHCKWPSVVVVLALVANRQHRHRPVVVDLEQQHVAAGTEADD